MQKARQSKGRPQGNAGDLSIGRFEYDRADEKRKVQEEIEDFLTERQEKKSPPPGERGDHGIVDRPSSPSK